MELNQIHKVYFVGIGGIGMSALARYFRRRGAEVYGYDRTATPLTAMLEAEGMHIHHTTDPDLIPEEVDLAVYTPAVPHGHPELLALRDAGVPLRKRAEVLEIISRGMRCIAIAGTHGKTTTSSITAHLLRTGDIYCTAFLGGIATNFGSNFVSGDSRWVVVEADEFDRSFLHLSPDIAAVLSTDADHLDIYDSAEELLRGGFQAFAKKLKERGQLLVREDLLSQFNNQPGVQTFGLHAGDFRASSIRVENGQFTFDYESSNHRIQGLRWDMPGRHNIENALVAITVALSLGVTPKDIRRGISSFAGIQRRFELLLREEDIVYIDDYAHHPTELRAAIGAARELYPQRQITGIFQPHLYSRTRDFAADFAAALSELDEVYLLDIYPAREEPIPGVDAGVIFEAITHQKKTRMRREDVVATLQGKQPEVLLTLGAGDIANLVEPIRKTLLENRAKSQPHE